MGHPSEVSQGGRSWTSWRLGRAAALVVVLWAAACTAPAVVLERVPAPPPPFERYPYLLEVRPDGARIAWSASIEAHAAVRYRVVEATSDGRVGLEAEVRAGSGSANLSGLPSGATVEYAVSLENAPSASGLRFRMAPPRGARTPFRVLVWGDSGSGTEAQIDVARQIALRHRGRPFDFALHTGDIAYPNGSHRYLTERYFRVYREWLSSVPVYPTPGNHDLQKGGDRAFAETFLRPRGIAGGRRYYSFDYANAHFIALDSNDGHRMTAHGGNLRDRESVQYAWLVQDLAAAARDTLIDWIIVFFHHPPYSGATGLFAGHGSDEKIRRSLVPIFDRFGVDLVFNGHDHHYERTQPLRGDTVAAEGTVYVVTGGGGGSTRLRSVGHRRWTAQKADVFHFVAVEIEGKTLRAEVIDRTGALADRFELAKP